MRMFTYLRTKKSGFMAFKALALSSGPFVLKGLLGLPKQNGQQVWVVQG